MPTITWNDQLPTGGTSLRGMFDSPWSFEETVARLYAASGQVPQSCDGGDKTTVEFVGDFLGAPFTVYDYKGDRQLHIGGREKLDVIGLQTALAHALAGVEPKTYRLTSVTRPRDLHHWPTGGMA